MNKKTLSLTVAALFALSVFTVGCEDKGDKGQENTMLMLGLVSLANSGSNFVDSCLITSGSSSFCQNNYGEGLGQTTCEGRFSGTFTTSKCTCTNAVGVCTVNFTGGKAEQVYYTESASENQSLCASLDGTFSTTCSE